MRRPGKGSRHGFTLIELLVAISIISVLVTMLLGVVMRARRYARDASCKGNLCQLWKATVLYANDSNDFLFVNDALPLRISNVLYANQSRSGWGHLYPKYLPENRTFYCPDDPVRDRDWAEYGWRHWETETGEVQSSYGYRGRQNLVADVNVWLHLAQADAHPQKVLGAEFYQTFTAPVRVHHAHHINVLRCNGGVQQVNKIVSFGPNDEDIQAALDAVDR